MVALGKEIKKDSHMFKAVSNKYLSNMFIGFGTVDLVGTKTISKTKRRAMRFASTPWAGMHASSPGFLGLVRVIIRGN